MQRIIGADGLLYPRQSLFALCFMLSATETIKSLVRGAQKYRT